MKILPGDCMGKKKIMIVYLLIIVNILTACWSQKELTDIAFVMGIGIDHDENGKYAVSFQIINPRNVVGGQGGGGGGGVQGLPITVYEGRGETVYEAVRETSQHVSRILYFSHANLVVLGEELAKEDIIDAFDSLERATQFRTTARVVVAKGAKASDLLQILAPLDQISVNKINKTVQFSERIWGENIEVSVAEVIDDIYGEGSQPVISGFLIKGDAEKGKSEEGLKTSKPAAPISADGIAIFRDGKLETWAEKETARGIVWLRNKVRETVVNVDWEDSKEAVAFHVIRSKTKIAPKLKNGKPELDIHIDTEGTIGETHVPIDVMDKKELKKLEKIIADEIKSEIEKTVALIQKEKTDVIGFGRKLSVEYPEYWKKHKNNWEEEIFPEADVTIHVHAFIRWTESRLKPFFYELKKHEGVE